ncbi:MAG: CoA transferase subunit A [Anaerovoracaceae bacterium]
MISKLIDAEKAIEGIKDGATIMVGGFLGTGSPEILIDALVKKGVKNLTVIGNDGGLPAGTYGCETARGIGKLIEAGMVKHIIASHVGMNPLIGKGMNDGTLECTLVPQGTLAEVIRAAGAGLGGVLTPTGVGTIIAEGKEVLEIDGKEYLLEKPLKADFALVRASECDEFGNFRCNLATKNFNTVMATAAETVIVASEVVNKVGEKEPDTYQMSGVYVDYVVGGEKVWQI